MRKLYYLPMLLAFASFGTNILMTGTIKLAPAIHNRLYQSRSAAACTSPGICVYILSLYMPVITPSPTTSDTKLTHQFKECKNAHRSVLGVLIQWYIGFTRFRITMLPMLHSDPSQIACTNLSDTPTGSRLAPPKAKMLRISVMTCVQKLGLFKNVFIVRKIKCIKN